MKNISGYKNKFPEISDNAFIAPNAFVIGDVVIGENSNIWYGTVIRGDVNYIRIGENTNIQDNSVVHVDSGKFPTIIGSNVTIGHSAVIHACEIEDYGFIGMQACILDGAVIEEKAMVGAGALVSPGKIVPSGELWVGRPARFMRKLTDEEIDYLEISAKSYVKLSKEHVKNI